MCYAAYAKDSTAELSAIAASADLDANN